MRDSIQALTSKIKTLRDIILEEYFSVLIIIFVGLSSFGLGYLAALEGQKESAIIRGAEEALQNASASSIQSVGIVGADAGSVVASKNGARYHFPWCAGAQQIKEINKIWFSSTEEARKAGYTPAANCKGLE